MTRHNIRMHLCCLMYVFIWMPPSQLSRISSFTGVKKFFANKGYEGELTVLADASNAALGPKCYENCERCSMKRDNLRNKDFDEARGAWTHVFILCDANCKVQYGAFIFMHFLTGTQKCSI